MTERIAIVTGGSRGLGKNAALKLAAKGVGIILTWNSSEQEALDVVREIEQKGVKAAALQLNVGDVSGFEHFAQQVGETLKQRWQRDTFDYLLNNAGVGLYAPYVETSEAQFDNVMNIHFKGPFFLTQRLLPLMKDGGRILNVSSGLARFALPGSSTYAAMKGAMEVLTRYQAKELGARGISANIIAPGAIETDFGGGRVRDNAELNQQIAAQTALGRVGLPDDIGDQVPGWHLVFFPCQVRNRLFWRFGFGGDPDPARARKGDIGAIRIEDLAASPTHKLIHIAGVVSEQHKGLEMFGRGASVMAQTCQRKIDAARIKVRQGGVLCRMENTVGGFIANLRQLGSGEMSRQPGAHGAIQRQRRTINNVGIRNFVARRLYGDMGVIILIQQG
jgi:NAD(P)-dependent dehydrogenase (short-subunit alcohol dehydrogenase family)